MRDPIRQSPKSCGKGFEMSSQMGLGSKKELEDSEGDLEEKIA